MERNDMPDIPFYGFEAEMVRYERIIKHLLIALVVSIWIVGKNAERDRAILKRRLIDGICFEPLAEEFDMSVRQIQNIVYKTQEKLFKHLSKH